MVCAFAPGEGDFDQMSVEGVASESQEEQVWLWREGDRVAWWSPSARGDLDRARPGTLDLCKLSELRSGVIQADIRTELGRDSKLAEAVCQALDEGRKVRLRLLRDLSDIDSANDWTRVPFEWMRWKGEPLHGRLMVERHVPRQAVEPLEPRLLLRGVKVFKRLSPEEDREFSEAFAPCGRLPQFDEIEVHDEAGSAAEFHDAALDLDQHSALVLVCHGTETDDRAPFRLPDGSTWALPLNRGMPPLVVLLVCGSDAGNLLSYARDQLFLSRSTQTVIVAAGKLAVEEAGRFLRRFLEEWAKGRAVYEIVRDEHAAVARRPDGLDARRLCVMGRGDLRLNASWGASPAQSWLDMPDADLAQRVRDGTDVDAAALTTLVNRSTLMCKLEGTGGYENDLRRRLKMSRHESLADLLQGCLRNARSGVAGPVQLWRLSEGWVMLALGLRDQLLERREEFEHQRQDFMPFPAQGDPSREVPHFGIEDLPSPVALAWEQVNDALDRQQLPDALLLLKEAFEVVVRFVASVAVMDLLRSTAAAREHTRERDQLIGRLFGARTALGPDAWVDCLRLALRDKRPTRMLGQLRDVAFTNRSPSRLMSLLTGDYVAWQNSDNYDMRRSPAELVPHLNWWLERLRELLEELSRAWVGWRFLDSHDGTRWHGPSPDTPLDGDEQRLDGDTRSLLMVHQDGRSLDLSPLITVQRCERCRRGRVFFFTERRTGTAEAGAAFRDYPNPHDNSRPHVPTLAALGLKSTAEVETRRGDEGARAEEERFAFHNFANAEKPRYLYDKLRDACDELDRGHGAGYVHMMGPEGFGKSWFARMLAEDAREMLGQRVLLCRINALGTSAAADFMAHLCAQARDQGLTGVDKAHELALEQADAPGQFATLIRELIMLNDLDRLTVAIDGLDELPEPVKQPAHLSQVGAVEAYRSPGEEGIAEISFGELEVQTGLGEISMSEIEESVEPIVSGSDEQSLLDFLPPSDRLPAGMFVLLTSREDLSARATQALAQLRTADGWIEIHLELDSQDNIDVVRRYVGRHVKGRELAISIMQRSGGVFLWAYHLVQAIVQGAFLEKDVLPDAGEFYSAYLDKLRRREGEDLFESVYLRLLLLLAAAKEPLTDSQLVRWGLSDTRLRSALGILRDFYSIHRSPKRYSIKHEGFQSYLRSDDQMAARLRQTHADIADMAFAAHHGRWSALDFASRTDRYTARWLPAHVKAAIKIRELNAAEMDEYLNWLKSLACTSTAATKKRGFADSMLISDALHACADVLGAAKRHHEAITVLEESISLRRQLLPDGPHGVRGDLAASLNAQGRFLAWLERNDEAIKVYSEALAIRRAVVAEGQQSGRGPISQTLHNLGMQLLETNRDDEAVLAFGEAITLRRKLVVEGQDSEREHLMASLYRQGAALAKLGRHDEALTAYDEAIALRCKLLSKGQEDVGLGVEIALFDRGRQKVLQERLNDAALDFGEAAKLRRPFVADGKSIGKNLLTLYLSNQAWALDKLGRFSEAHDAISETVSIHRDLVAAGQQAAGIGFGRSLRNSAGLEKKLGRVEEAIASLGAAIPVFRESVAEGQVDASGELAYSLYRSAEALNSLSRFEEAVAAYAELVRLLRDDPLAGRLLGEGPPLIRALILYGRGLCIVKRYVEAAEVLEEAVSGLRRLVAEGQGAMFRPLAAALAHRAIAWAGLNHHEEAAAAFGESVVLRHKLVADGQQGERSELAMSLYHQSLYVAKLKRHLDAAKAVGDATSIRRELVAEGQQSERAGLCDALSLLGEQLRVLERNEEAAAAFGEAASDRRERACQGELGVRRFLAGSLYSQGHALAALRRYGEAVTAFGEAASVLNVLVNEGQQESREPLASSLDAQGFALRELGRIEDAVGRFEEAIALRRELMAEGQLSIHDSLALVLNNKAHELRMLGRLEAAIDACDESIALRRALLSEGQIGVRRGLGNALGNRGAALTELGRTEEALAAFEEAIAMASKSISDGTSVAKRDLVWLLRLRGTALRSAGRQADGLASIREAIEAARGFISAGFKEVREPLADALTDQGEVLLDEADVEGARASLEEAIAILEERSAEDPKWELKKDLAKALTVYARALDQLGRAEDAQTARDRAAALVQQKPQ